MKPSAFPNQGDTYAASFRLGKEGKHIMKTGIFIALAALALVVFGVPDAQGKSGPGVDHQIFGNILTIDVTDDTPSLTTSLVTAIAKGQPGKADVSAVLVFETEFVFNPEGDCPPGFPLESNVISFEWGENYNDGSVLSGAATEGQVFCLDLDFTRTAADLTGTIVGATGRFEGAVGSPWRVEASGVVGSNAVNGTLAVDLN